MNPVGQPTGFSKERGETMKTSLIKAIELILSGNAELLDILSVTAEMSIFLSSMKFTAR